MRSSPERATSASLESEKKRNNSVETAVNPIVTTKGILSLFIKASSSCVGLKRMLGKLLTLFPTSHCNLH